MKKKSNNYAFIDAQNLYLAIAGAGWKLDYKKFRVYLQEKYAISKAYIFTGKVVGKKMAFVSDLRAKFVSKLARYISKT